MKEGSPYIYHPIRMALKCESKDAEIVALLHDVVEDTDYYVSSIGLSSEQMKTLDLLIKYGDEDYMEYIKRIKDNPIACEVKINDQKDNMNLEDWRM